MTSSRKKIKILKKSFGIFAILFLLTIVSCNKDEPEKELTLENIKLSIEQVNSPVPPKTTIHSYWTQLVGNDIFFSPEYNIILTDQFMLKYDTQKNTYTEVTPHKSVAPVAYINKLATDGKNLYYIANEAWKYTVATNTWSPLNYPSSVKANNGEPAIAYHNGKLYYVGGRNGTKQFRCYDIASDSWFNMPDIPENVYQGEGIAVGNQIFVMGGNLKNKIYNYDIDSKQWSVKKEAPFNILTTFIYNLYLAKTKNRFVYYCSQNKISIYDTKTDQWRVNALTGLPGNEERVNLVAFDDHTLYLIVKDFSKVFLIYKIRVMYE